MDSQHEELQACLGDVSDLADLDGDFLSDAVESCFLGTNILERDSDHDGIEDGLDGSPLASGLQIPLDITVAAIREIHPGTNHLGCDEASLWDPYFSVFGYDIPALAEEVNIRFSGLTSDLHGHDRAPVITGPELIGAKESGTGTVSGGTASFDLDPDLTTWNGGLKGIGLRMAFGATIVDHDHHSGLGGDGKDDYMPFDVPVEDILKLGEPAWSFESVHASDGNTGHIHCQAQVEVRTTFFGLTEAILDVAGAKRDYPGTLIRCTHEYLGGCAPDGSHL